MDNGRATANCCIGAGTCSDTSTNVIETMNGTKESVSTASESSSNHGSSGTSVLQSMIVPSLTVNSVIDGSSTSLLSCTNPWSACINDVPE
jgi:hypothetical protein